MDYASDLAHDITPSIAKTSEAKYAEIAPFDQVDQLMLQCSLLTSLATDAPKPQVKAPERKRENKLKRKLA